MARILQNEKVNGVSSFLYFRGMRMYIIEVDHLQQLFSALEKRGYSLIGPPVRDGAIVFDSLESTADLPKGWTDDQRAGSYALR
ncbi:hypothetical protein EHM92_01660, partial [bacterium]